MAHEGMDRTEIDICTDCLQLLANGEVTDGQGNDITEKHSKRMSQVWGDLIEITLGGEDTGFSWQSCDGCESPLGGDRYHATAWTPGTEDVAPSQDYLTAMVDGYIEAALWASTQSDCYASAHV